MADTSFPKDKESGLQKEERIPELSETAEAESDSKPTTGQNLLLLGILWLFWSIFCIFNVLYEIDTCLLLHMRMSRLQYFVYERKWDVWVYKHDYYKVLTPPVINKICTVALTVIVMVYLALMRALPGEVDWFTTYVIYSVLAVLVPLFSWVGLESKEIQAIVMPFFTLIGFTTHLFLQRAGFGDVKSKLGLSDRATKWFGSISLYSLLASCIWVFGIGNDQVVLCLVALSINWAYKKLG